ncbi:MAG: chemotaxis protein CheC [Candidatus Thermoplasmatota archaeon]|nr:chemotaxis protein CheC [Candidatus Thermoplasmatota archaeon]
MKEIDESKVLGIVKEFANVGAGNAATALASLLDIEIVNEVTSCNFLKFSEVGEWLGGSDKIVVGVYTQLCGDLRGGVLVVLSDNSAAILMKHLTNEEINLSNLSQIHASALREIGNICLCWYLVAVSKMIDTDLIPAPPDVSIDMLGAIIDLPLANLEIEVDSVIAVHTVFKSFEKEFDGYFLLLPEQQMLDTILEKMGDTMR